MTWTRLDDGFCDRSELLELDRSTRLLYVEALVWCNRTGSNGVISRGLLSRFTDHDDPQTAAAELVTAGLWDETAVGWTVVDFLRDQLSREQVEQLREKGRQRQARARLHRSGDHSLCVAPYCKLGNAVTDGVSNETPNLSEPVQATPRPGTGTVIEHTTNGVSDAVTPNYRCEHGNPNGRRLTTDGTLICLQCSDQLEGLPERIAVDT
jgi:hypothetical protein